MSNFIFLRHVLTGAVRFPFALSYFSCVHAHPMFVLLPSYTLVSFALFCHTVLERVRCFWALYRLSLILPGEPDDGVRLMLLTG
jgi:hypothetical protein